MISEINIDLPDFVKVIIMLFIILALTISFIRLNSNIDFDLDIVFVFFGIITLLLSYMGDLNATYKGIAIFVLILTFYNLKRRGKR